MRKERCCCSILLAVAVVSLLPAGLWAQDDPAYLRDRGTGIPLSQFGTYIRPGEVIVYPFYEYYYDHNFEYEPLDFARPPGDSREFRGRYEAHEGLLFVAFGITDRLAVELEAGVITARLDKADADDSEMPPRLEESGLNDVEGQIRWRWNHENERTPEFFNYFETVFPTGEKNSLIGTSAWEFKLGFGVVKGLNWGTVTARAGVDYDTGEKTWGVGEYAIEYLRRLSNRYRVFVMVEGSEDELALVPEMQWFLTPRVLFKAAAGVGVTSKATDFAPEIGLMIWLR